LGDDFICGFVTCLGVERAKYDTARGVVFEQAIVMGLDAALGKLGVKIIGSSGGLAVGQLNVGY